MLRTLLNATNYKSTLLRTVVPVTATAIALQGAVAIPSCITGTEKFYDISGSITYISCTALSLYLPVLRARLASKGASLASSPSLWNSLLGRSLVQGGFWNFRQVAISAAVTIWATRLGSHLFTRILTTDGKDSRFDKIRDKPPFLFALFMAQAAWVSLCLLPVASLNALPSSVFTSLSPLASAISVTGFGIFAFGLIFEVMADRQKTQWLKEKKEKKHSEEFLTRGLWGKSRHPNYFGEITLWAGMATVSAAVLASKAGQSALGWSGSPMARIGAVALAMASPAASALILIKGTGVPPSEIKYDKKYGDRKDYRDWKENTPMVIPKFW